MLDGLGPDTAFAVEAAEVPHGMVMAPRVGEGERCLYVGGQFETAGTLSASSIARWCCTKTPAEFGDSINGTGSNAGKELSFTDDGDGLPESVSCEGVRYPLSAGTELEACGLRFAVGTDGADRLDFADSTLPVVVFAGPGDDWVVGSEQADLILTAAGNDHVSSGGGDDQIFAGGGDDSLFGGAGDDRLIAGPGDDEVDTGAGENAVDGGLGIDAATLRAGDESVDVEQLTFVGPAIEIPASGSGGRALLALLLLVAALTRRGRGDRPG
jgi:Ca2+-binding RTX toxin-like protein